MSIIVAYHTKTGHSRKLARAVAADLGTEALDIRRWKPGLQADTLLLFGGIYGGKSDGPMLVFARALRPRDVHRAVLFTSCASGKGRQGDVRTALADAGIEVEAAEFVCPGSFLMFRIGRPNARDIREAIAFARQYAAPRRH